MFHSAGPEYDVEIIENAKDELSESGKWSAPYVSFEAMGALRAWAKEEGVMLQFIKNGGGARVYLRKRYKPAPVFVFAPEPSTEPAVEP